MITTVDFSISQDLFNQENWSSPHSFDSVPLPIGEGPVDSNVSRTAAQVVTRSNMGRHAMSLASDKGFSGFTFRKCSSDKSCFFSRSRLRLQNSFQFCLYWLLSPSAPFTGSASLCIIFIPFLHYHCLFFLNLPFSPFHLFL